MHNETNCTSQEELNPRYNEKDLEFFRVCLSELLESKLMEVFNVSSYQIINLFSKFDTKDFTNAELNSKFMNLFVDGMLEMNGAPHLMRRKSHN